MTRFTPTSDEEVFLSRQDLVNPLAELRRAFKRGRLTLYLGAGISVASGLPSWNTLVAALYYSAVHADWSDKWKPYPNYLFALGEWLLKNSGESPEVIAGKIENYFGQGTDFENELLNVLYSPWRSPGMGPGSSPVIPPDPFQLRQGNKTLDGVARLCEATTSAAGLYAIVTTNYDNLLERALEGTQASLLFKAAWKKSDLASCGGENGCASKSIFHVHGYLPPKLGPEPPGVRSSFDEILLTEAHYHGAAKDPYSWSNLCLIHCLSASVGLVVGMSMTDRNIRRLLHALNSTRLLESLYLVLKEPEAPELTPCDEASIQKKAIEYHRRFVDSGVKTGSHVDSKLDKILTELTAQEKTITERMLESFGIKVIWVRSHDETALLLKALN